MIVKDVKPYNSYFEKVEDSPQFSIYESLDGFYKTIFNKRTYDITYVNQINKHRILESKEVYEKKDAH